MHSFRKAEFKDAGSIAKLSFQLGYEATLKETEERIQYVINHPQEHIFLVAVENEIVIGWIHAFYAVRIESDAFVEIGGLVVDKKFRSKGVGKTLINEIIEWTKNKSCTKLRLRSNVKRKEAHEFYKGFGFKEKKEQKVFDLSI